MARCLYHSLTEFELMLSLRVSRHLMAHFKSITVSLQSADLDIVTGFNMIKTVKETLQNVSCQR